MKIAFSLGFALLVVGIALGVGATAAFFVMASAGAMWLAVVGLVALRRATRLAMRPIDKDKLHRQNDPDFIQVLARASGIAATSTKKDLDGQKKRTS